MILTHWGRDKVATTFRTTFSSAVSWNIMYELRLIFTEKPQINNILVLAHIMANCLASTRQRAIIRTNNLRIVSSDSKTNLLIIHVPHDITNMARQHGNTFLSLAFCYWNPLLTSTLLALFEGIHRLTLDSPHKGAVRQASCFPCWFCTSCKKPLIKPLKVTADSMPPCRTLQDNTRTRKTLKQAQVCAFI